MRITRSFELMQPVPGGALGAVLFAVLFITACSETTISDQITGALSLATPDEIYIRLLELDRDHTGVPELELRLAEILTQAGRTNEARVYLESARRNLRPGSSPELKTELHTLLARHAYDSMDYAETVESSTRGIEAAGRLNEGADRAERLVVLHAVRAQARSALNDHEAALDDYRYAEQISVQGLSRQVLPSYARSLVATGRYGEALQKTQLKNRMYGYDYAGILDEVWLYEQLDRPESALLSLAIRFEELRHEQDEPTDLLIERIRAIAGEPDAGTGTATGKVMELVSAFFRDDWQAVRQWSPVAQVTDHPFLDYIQLVAATRSQARPENLARLVELEPWFRAVQGYYYYLWTALKGSGSSYSLDTMSGPLERTILLAPESGLALETRREICRLAGISEGFAESLLLRSEIDELVSRAFRYRDANQFSALYRLLESPDNRYTMYAVLVLSSVAEDPWARSVLESRLAVSDGRVRERLRAILTTRASWSH